MESSPSQSLRNFATNQPPLLMFTVCLMAFGITMVVLAYIVGVNEVPNPDVTDWNKFLTKLTELQICVDQKDSRNVNNKRKQVPEPLAVPHFAVNMTQNNSVPRFVDHSKSMSAVLSKVVDRVTEDDNVVDDLSVVDVSVMIKLWISGEVNILNSFPSVVRGSITGKQLGFNVKHSSKFLNVTFNFPKISNFTCQKHMCHIFQEVCVALKMSSFFLPHTKSPERCQKVHASHPEVMADFIEPQKLSSNNVCQNKTQIHLQYIPDSRLTEMLSMNDRSIVNLHLMHTSYFMFVMVMTLLCYVLVKGRFSPPKLIAVEKLPLHS